VNLYHEGAGSAALPIDSQLAAQIEQKGMQLREASLAHVRRTAPVPGSESALRRLFASLLVGRPIYDEMVPQFAEVTRRQLAQLQKASEALGPITSVKFLSPDVLGGDAFQVSHERGSTFFGILLTGDGKIQTAGLMASPPALAGSAKAIHGPYEPVQEMAFGSPSLKVFRPVGAGTNSSPGGLPLVIWGSGGCAFDSPVYTGLLSTISSHGFVVVTTAGRAQQGFADRATNLDDLKAALAWAERENIRAGSALNGKIELTRVGAIGQSCGGELAIDLGADPRVSTIAVFNYGIGGSVLKKLHGPVLLVNGHETDFAMGASRGSYDEIGHLPAFYAALRGAGHLGTVIEPGGGEFANVASNWFLWQLRGDKTASAMFVGQQCGLCVNKNWDVASKRMEN
jgi:hypothetical protein